MENIFFNYVVSFYTVNNRSLNLLSKRLFVYRDPDYDVIPRLEFECRRYARSYESILRKRGRNEKVVYSYERVPVGSSLPNISLNLLS